MRATVLVSVIFLALLGLFTPKTSFHPTAILIGGEYTVQAGETRSGDMLLLYAHVEIAEGGQVDGNIQVLGSVLKVSGSVSGDIHAYGSQVYVATTGVQIDGTINNFASLRGLPKFPSILLVIS